MDKYTKRKIDKLLTKYVNSITKKASDDFWSVVSVVNNEMKHQVIDMYESFIDKFYEYETTSYIRHEQHRPGTGKGTNLYKALTCKTIGKGKGIKLSVVYSGQDMDDGYEYDTPDNVMEYVLHGIRFPFGNGAMNWQHTYIGDYFSYKGKLQDAIYMFDAKFNDVSEGIFRKLWKEKGYN